MESWIEAASNESNMILEECMVSLVNIQSCSDTDWSATQEVFYVSERLRIRHVSFDPNRTGEGCGCLWEAYPADRFVDRPYGKDNYSKHVGCCIFLSIGKRSVLKLRVVRQSMAALSLGRLIY